MPETSKIPDPTIERLALYSRPLETCLKKGISVISSEKLAELCGVNPAQIRKDLAYFGGFGVRGVGYDVRDLLPEIKKILGTNQEWTLCIVGMGYLGKALAEDENFMNRGYKFIAVFDSDPQKVGEKLPCGLTIEPVTRIREIIQANHIEIGIITTPPFEAQRMSDLLMDCGVKAILNFTSYQVRAKDCCVVENADLTVKLENLAYYLGKKVMKKSPTSKDKRL